jgi:hypothetical protein
MSPGRTIPNGVGVAFLADPACTGTASSLRAARSGARAPQQLLQAGVERRSALALSSRSASSVAVCSGPDAVRVVVLDQLFQIDTGNA